ncbi:lysine transporter LysE [Roseibium aquae]|uniref:Lysine transporter LysE n=1 Tax=Roseibium aquae TaxID=1323746 RepID=A0A916TKU7_9HYPH|nr:LysE family transporter [Roseibium aquae]GGB51730.1 lysine transporter LysE [Roseibium aquae]
MNLLEYAAIGFGMGILTTAPVGPVNVMAIQHAAQSGFRQGLFVGLGAALADSIYAAVAVFGVSAVTRFIDTQVDLIKLVGGLVLIVFGLKVLRTRPHLETKRNGGAPSFVGDMTAAFAMVITNPAAAFAFVAIVGGLGDWRPEHGNHTGALAMVAGVSAGACTWWAGLSAVVSRYSHKIDDRWLDRANQIAGTILIVLGALIYGDLALELLA